MSEPGRESVDRLVVGLGSPDRGDDAVGPAVAAAVAALALRGVRVVDREDPTSLIDLWDGYRLCVVVDAICSGQPAGTLSLLEVGSTAGRLSVDAWGQTGRGGSHAFGLAAAVELARALHRLPPRVVVMGIEAVGMNHGQGFSDPVAAAIPVAAAAVVEVLGENTPRDSPSLPDVSAVR